MSSPDTKKGGWQPIETAPTDGTRILVAGGKSQVHIARWNDDRYAQKPGPYFAYESSGRPSVSDDRAAQPTLWQPLPAPPETGK